MWILEPVWKQDYDRGEKEGGGRGGNNKAGYCQGVILNIANISYLLYFLLLNDSFSHCDFFSSHIFQNIILCLLRLFYWSRRLE